jgi:Zn-dependent protease with chaperone function
MSYSLVLKFLLFSITCIFAQTGDFSYVEVPEPSAEAIHYHKSGNVIWAVNIILGFLIPLLFLLTGFSARIRNWAKKLGMNKWFLTVFFYFIIFSIINFFIDFPLSYYIGFFREHAYNLSNQTFIKWLTDSMNSFLVGTFIGGIFISVIYFLLKKSPERWWLYASIFMVPFMTIMMLVFPIWIAPIFNDFGPMNDKALEAKILALAEETGIENSRVFEVNKSIDTKKVNAYVAGFHNTKRIVLWDTIIEKLNEKELLSVMAHEMGHYALAHSIKSLLFASIMMMITFYATYRTANLFINRYKDKLGFNKFSDIASLPLLFLLMSLFQFIMTPISTAFSRYHELEADRFSLEIMKDNHAAGMAFVKLQEENLAVPHPGWLYKIWRSSHPTLGDRINFCNNYRPWEKGEPLKYESFFNIKSND